MTVAVRLTDAPTVDGFGLWLLIVVAVLDMPAKAVEATRAEANEAAIAAERNFSMDTFEKIRGNQPPRIGDHRKGSPDENKRRTGLIDSCSGGRSQRRNGSCMEPRMPEPGEKPSTPIGIIGRSFAARRR